MFTGIIESIGEVIAIQKDKENVHFTIKSPISNELKVDQSVAHNGACLTVTHCGDGIHKVTAIKETILKTNLGDWQVGDLVNLERCMKADGRFDGHMVYGHVDGLGKCIRKKDQEGSTLFEFAFASEFDNYLVEKGSICLNGISLTIFDVGKGRFSVAIIPYTIEHTNLQKLEVNGVVNLEFDILGKYLLKIASSGMSEKP
jgi:riboflavin synthase